MDKLKNLLKEGKWLDHSQWGNADTGKIKTKYNRAKLLQYLKLSKDPGDLMIHTGSGWFNVFDAQSITNDVVFAHDEDGEDFEIPYGQIDIVQVGTKRFDENTNEMIKPPTKKGATISTGKVPSFNDDIDIPATGFTHHRVKANTGKQHHITAYDDMWEEKDDKEEMKLKNLFKKKKSKKDKKVDEYVAQKYNERDKVIAMSPFSTRNEPFDGFVERKSGERYYVKPEPESLKKMDYAQAQRLKDGIWLNANQLKKRSTFPTTMAGLNLNP